MGPALTLITIADEPDNWRAAGFAVHDDRIRIGGTTIEFRPDAEASGIVAWGFDGADDGSIDGLPTVGRTEDGRHDGEHPNGVERIDHVVVMTDDLDRTSAALVSHGFESRRRRDIPDVDPPRSQIFWWAGETIIELVGPATPQGPGPASIWGLALTVADLDATAEILGDAMGKPRDAVQSGRKIAGLRTAELGIAVPIAMMSPHYPVR